MTYDTLPLLLGGVILLGAQCASAGLMSTATTLQDFQFDETNVDDFYLTATGTGRHSLESLELWVSGRPSPRGRVTNQLTDSLNDIQMDPGAGGLLFLVRNDRVTNNLEQRYLENGLAVPVRTTDLRGTTLKDVYDALPASLALDEGSPQKVTPRIANPGTLALLLIAVVPLVVVRHRR